MWRAARSNRIDAIVMQVPSRAISSSPPSLCSNCGLFDKVHIAGVRTQLGRIRAYREFGKQINDPHNQYGCLGVLYTWNHLVVVPANTFESHPLPCSRYSCRVTCIIFNAAGSAAMKAPPSQVALIGLHEVSCSLHYRGISAHSIAFEILTTHSVGAS